MSDHKEIARSVTNVLNDSVSPRLSEEEQFWKLSSFGLDMMLLRGEYSDRDLLDIMQEIRTINESDRKANECLAKFELVDHANSTEAFVSTPSDLACSLWHKRVKVLDTSYHPAG